MPAACHSTKWSGCNKITECAKDLSQSILAGKLAKTKTGVVEGGGFSFPGVNLAMGDKGEQERNG